MISQISFRDYIAAAELAWFRVLSSGKRTRLRSRDGAPISRLPLALSSRQKVYRYFRRWWSPRLASNMLASLPLLMRNGRLYVINYDFPPISMTPGSVRLRELSQTKMRLQTTLRGGLLPERVSYTLTDQQVNNRPMIIARSGAACDWRYRRRLVHQE